MQEQPEYRLLRRALDWELGPLEVLRLVRDDRHPVALLGDWAGGGAVIGSEPARGPQPAAGPR